VTNEYKGRRIRDMEIGERCVTVPWAVWIDGNGISWIDGRFPVWSTVHGTATMGVYRRNSGYSVDSISLECSFPHDDIDKLPVVILD